MSILRPVTELPPIPADERVELADDQVDIWCFAYESATARPQTLAAYLELMTDHERTRYHRYLFERDRRMFAATRALVRTTLSRYADVAPADWRFEQGSHGKPHLASHHGETLFFNLSNAHGLVACAVSRREVGLDVENTQRKTEPTGIADRFFAPSEVAALHRLPRERQSERFFSYWTLKESYIKARGLGLAIPLGQFAFELDAGNAIRIGFDERLEDQPERYAFSLCTAGPRHFLAVCREAHQRQARQRWLDDLDVAVVSPRR